MEDTLVPIFAIMFLFGGPIAAVIVLRVLAHRERMEMLRQGFMPPPNPRDMRRAMKYGWQPGPMPPPGSPNMAGMPNMPQYARGAWAYGYDPQFQLRRGVQVACVGLALLIGLSFIGHRGDGTFVYGPWLLGGLIPMFVGVAQIISAVINGAQFGRQAVGVGVPPYSADPGYSAAPPPPGPGSPPPPSGPYGGWRPGPTPEIEKPASPPDYR